MDSEHYARTDEDLRRAAEIQFDALKISADHFDLGQIGEAARMANALFVLVGEGMRTHTSIFDAANQKQGRLYRSTKPTGNDLGCSLVFLELKKVEENAWEVELRHAGRVALKGGRNLTFSEWWAEPVIVNDAVNLTRGDIVRILRDKNGGAHFDAVVKDTLVARAIRSEVGLFNVEGSDGTPEIVPFGLEFCMRQIATEFWYSVDVNKSFEVQYDNKCEKHAG